MATLHGLETALRTAIAVVVLPLVLILHSLAGIALALAGLSAAAIHPIYRSISRACLVVGGTTLVVHGAERIQADQAYIVVPNHESSWDPMCLIIALPRLVIRFVAKQQFMQTPIVGRALRLTGNIRVLRSETQGDVARIHAVMDGRDPAVSVLFFAEGTRARDGALHPFKSGAFATALGYGLPILPVGLAGTRKIWRPTTLPIRRGTVTIEIGEPIPIDGLGADDRDALRDRTFAAVAALRTRARERLRAMGVDPGGSD